MENVGITQGFLHIWDHLTILTILRSWDHLRCRTGLQYKVLCLHKAFQPFRLVFIDSSRQGCLEIYDLSERAVMSSLL